MRKVASSRLAAVSASTAAQYAASSAAARAGGSPLTVRMTASGMPSRRNHATSRACSSWRGS
jgi:hypothetical protein